MKRPCFPTPRAIFCVIVATAICAAHGTAQASKAPESSQPTGSGINSSDRLQVASSLEVNKNTVSYPNRALGAGFTFARQHATQLLRIAGETQSATPHIDESEFLTDRYAFVVSAENAASGQTEFHNQSPLFSVTWVYGAKPADLAARVAEAVRTARRINMPFQLVLPMVSSSGSTTDAMQSTSDSANNRSVKNVKVSGASGYAIENMPGSNPNTQIFVAVADRLYEIVVWRPALDAETLAILGGIKLFPSSFPISSLNLKQDKQGPFPLPEGFFIPPVPADLRPPIGLSRADVQNALSPLATGCQDYNPSANPLLFIPWIGFANANTGRSNAGSSYYGEGLHKYCNRPGGSNDYYALDFPLNSGDHVKPMLHGTVVSAGWATGGFSPYGRVVVIQNGSNFWTANHLSSIWVSKGQVVNETQIIGQAGGSSNANDGVLANHLHSALYKNGLIAGGAVYGGIGLRPRWLAGFQNGNYVFYSGNDDIAYRQSLYFK